MIGSSVSYRDSLAYPLDLPPPPNLLSMDNKTPALTAPLPLHEYLHFSYQSYHVAHPLPSSPLDAMFTQRDAMAHERAFIQALADILHYPGIIHHPDGLAASLGSLLSRCLTSSDVLHAPTWNRFPFMDTFSTFSADGCGSVGWEQVATSRTSRILACACSA